MKLTSMITGRIFSGKVHHLLRRSYTSSSAAAAVDNTKSSTTAAPRPRQHRKGWVFHKLYEAGDKMSSVLHNLVGSTGRNVPKQLLVLCLKDLRRLGKYQQCLEILDWFEKGEKYASSDMALRIDILYKLKGLGEAEKYFDAIPCDLKNHAVYGSLLSCYSTELATDKAVATFKKMDEMGIANNALGYNSLLSLFVKVGQPQKVQELVAEMKDKKIPLNNHSYNFWIQSYRLLGDLEGVERAFQDAQEQAILKDDWIIHSNVASEYIEFSQFEKAISHLEKMENVLDSYDHSNRTPYLSLISLYAKAGKSESVVRTWKKLTTKFKATHNTNYMSLLQAFSKLDDIKGLETHFWEWESSCKHYDDRVVSALISAYLKRDMLEQADLMLKHATEKAGKILCSPHVNFMNYYFEKGQTDYALKHMESAIVSNWKPRPEKLDPCFQHFKDGKDIDGLEKFCQLLKKAHALDARGYLWMLQTYVDAGKTSPDMRVRLEEDGINVTPELEELLEQVCPSRF